MTEFLDPGSAGIQALFLGLFDVSPSCAVAAWVYRGWCTRGMGNTEVNPEVNTEVKPVKRPCKLSKTGPKYRLFSKTGPKFSKN